MTNPIGALFGRSPIKPIQGHMEVAQGSIVSLGEFLDAAIEKDWPRAESLLEAISQAERDADEIKRDIRNHLPKSLFLPFARSDLLDLLHSQDELANRSREIARLIFSRRMELPADLVPAIKACYSIQLEASERAQTAIKEMDELLETGFRGKEAEFVESLIAQLDDMEARVDAQRSELNQLVFQMETTLPPVEVMFLYKLIEQLNEVSAISHKVGGHLLTLMAN